ncbi:CDP-alcohol phosphatidyltransferase family protein [Paracoccaceae bacterium Fryx2]|nr:CDP-alcohol phosphatidyltransferase family protein [Paracoccaceae bacterium Fryx2]
MANRRTLASGHPAPGLHGAAAGFVWLGLGNLVGVGVVAAILAPGRAGVVAATVGFALLLAAAAAGMRAHYPHARAGLCNMVTQTRAALAAVLAVPLVTPGLLAQEAGLAWGLAGLAAVALALDGVDGWLARRSGLASGFGARFDMEVDAALALVLSVLALQGGKAGVWVLALGVARYGFVVAGWMLPWLDRPLPERFSRKMVCVVQIAVLVVLLLPVVVAPWSQGLAAAAVAAVAWSFAVDVAWLARGRR